MMGFVTRVAVVAMLAVVVMAAPRSADASLIGQTLTHECPQCAPPFSQSFVVVQGSPELTPFDQWEVDVEADTIRITWLISGGIIDLDFIFTGITGGLTSVTVDPTSTYLPDLLTFTQTSIDSFHLGRTVTAGQFLLLNIVQPAGVPEPATLALLGLAFAAAGLVRRRRGA